jgi:hypothetical protein
MNICLNNFLGNNAGLVNSAFESQIRSALKQILCIYVDDLSFTYIGCKICLPIYDAQTSVGDLPQGKNK